MPGSETGKSSTMLSWPTEELVFTIQCLPTTELAFIIDPANMTVLLPNSNILPQSIGCRANTKLKPGLFY